MKFSKRQEVKRRFENFENPVGMEFLTRLFFESTTYRIFISLSTATCLELLNTHSLEPKDPNLKRKLQSVKFLNTAGFLYQQPIHHL